MLNELMVLLAVSSINLESHNFQVRNNAEKMLSSCGIFAGAHVETLRNHSNIEVRSRANRLWQQMPDFYAIYNVIHDRSLKYNDFHKAAQDQIEYFGVEFLVN